MLRIDLPYNLNLFELLANSSNILFSTVILVLPNNDYVLLIHFN